MECHGAKSTPVGGAAARDPLGVRGAIAGGCAGDDDGVGGGGAGDDFEVPPGIGDGPAVERGGEFLGTPERFNRYYTEPDWTPLEVIHASPTANVFAQNVLVGVSLAGAPLPNPDALLIMVDDSVGGNQYTRNAYVSGRLEGREPGDGELREDTLDATWFAAFRTGRGQMATGFAPLAGAPWAQTGEVLDDAPADMFGAERSNPTALGPLSL